MHATPVFFYTRVGARTIGSAARVILAATTTSRLPKLFHAATNSVVFYTRAYMRVSVRAGARLRGAKQWAAVIVLVLALGGSVFASLARPLLADATTADTVNFQARLETAAGAITNDGNYNVEFNLYNASSGGSALWTEDDIYVDATHDYRLRVVNGYLTVNLGAVNPFPNTINWDQDLYITMNIGGTGTSIQPTSVSSTGWDGEMSPRLKLTAVPYAFSAGQLSHVSGANSTTLGFTAPTGTDSLLLPDESGTLCVQNSANCGFALSSGSGAYIQNGTGLQANANFHIQSTAVGSPTAQFQLKASQTADLITLEDSSGNPIAGFNNGGALYYQSGSFTGTLVQDSLSASTSYHLPDTGNANETICTVSTCTGGAGGSLSSTGTANHVARFSGPTSLANSQLYDNGSFIGLGTTTSNGLLSVVSTGSTLSGLYVQGAPSSTASTVVFQPGGSQTGYTLEIKDSSGATVDSFAPDGSFTQTGGTVTLNGATTVNNSLTVTNASGLTLGVGGTTQGFLYLANNTNSNLSVIVANAPSGTGNATYQLPSITGGTTDTVCVQTLDNCQFASGNGAAFIQNGNSFGADAVFGTNDNFNLAVRTNGLNRFNVDTSGNINLLQSMTIAGAVPTVADAAGFNVTLGAGAANGSTVGNTGGVLTLQGGAAAGTGNNNGGNVVLNGGAATGTGSAGNIILNASGGNVGIGNSSPSSLLAVGSSSQFTVDGSGNVVAQGALKLGVPAGSTGQLYLANGGNSNYSILQSNAPTGSGNATFKLPTIAAGTIDTICTVNTCTGGAGGSVASTGTAGHLALFQTSTSLINSLFTDDGTSVQVNTSSDAGLLSLVGATATQNTLFAQGAASMTTAVAVIEGGATPGAGGNLLQLQDSTATPVVTWDAAGNEVTTGNFSQTGAATFSTGTGNVSLNGNTTIAAGKNLSFATGAGNFDQSQSTGTFYTGTGNVNLNGATSVTGSNTFTVGTGASVFGGTVGVTGTSTFTGLATFNGGVTVANNSNFSQTGSGTFSTGTGGVTLNGNTSISGTNTLTVGTGATSLGGTLGVSGLTTLSGGLTVTGATNINTTGTANTNINTGTNTGNVAIGNTTGTFSLASSALNIDTSGNISGAGTLSLSGAITGATSGNTINGLIINSGALTGVTGITYASGAYNFDQSASSGTFKTGTGAVSLNGDTTLASGKTLTLTTLPAATNDTALCYNSSSQIASCTDTFAIAPSTGSFVRTNPSSTADNTIVAPATAGVVALTLKGNTTANAHVLDIYNSASTPVLQDYVDANGVFNIGQIIQPTANNTIDLGTNSAAFRTGYFGTSVVVGGATLAPAQLQFAAGATTNINVAQESGTNAGDNLTLTAGQGGSSNANGGVLALQGGAAGGTGNNNGGNVTINGGAKTGTGTIGTVAIQGTGGATTIGGTLAVTGASTFTGLVTANGGLTVATGQHLIVNGDDFTDLTGDGLTVSSNALTVDSTSATGFFRNGGNSFGGAASLGTNDNFALNIRTNGTTKLTVSAAGDLSFAQSSTINSVQQTGTNTGNNITIAAGQGGSGGAAGGTLGLVGGAGAGTDQNGGDVTIDGGAKTGTGTKGSVTIQGAGGATTVGGTLSVGGATTLSSTLGVTGLATLSGGLTATGTTNINTTGTAATSIGNSGAALTLQGTSASTFAATNGSFTTTVGFITPTANNAINFPNEAGTLCIQNSVNCGFALASASGNYVQFAPGSAQADASTNSSIFINKTGSSGNILELQAGGSDAFVIDHTGNASFSGTLAVTGTSTFTGLATFNGGVTIGNNSSFDQSGSSGTFKTGTGAVSLNGNATLASGKTLTLTTLPAATNDTALCYNSSSQVASCNDTFAVAPSSGSFVRTNPNTTADNTITAPATAGVVTLTLKGNAIANAHLLDIYDSASTPVLQDYIDASGVLNVGQIIQPTANNTIDLGTSSARFRTGYFGTSIDIAGSTLTSNQLQFVTGGARTINIGQETGTTAGDQLNITAGQGGASNANGGVLALSGGAAGGAGNNNGGNVTVTGGAKTGTGTIGTVTIQGSGGATTIGGTLGVTGASIFTGLVTANGGLTVATGQNFTVNGDVFTDLTGSGLTVSSGALTVDDSSSTGFFRNGGNSFGGVANLGTNDNNGLNIRTNNLTRLTVTPAGDLTFASGAGNFDQHNSTGTFQSGTGSVSLNGDTTIATGKTLTINTLGSASNNTALCYNSSSQVASCNNSFETTTGNDFIKNQTTAATIQAASEFFQGTSGNVTSTLRGESSHTADILDLQTGAAGNAIVAKFDKDGNITAGTINGATITSTTFNTATISGGTLSGGTFSGGTVSSGTLTSSAVNSLGVTASAVTATGALSVSSGGAGQLTLSSATGDIGTGSNTINGQTISSAASFSGTLAVNMLGAAGSTLLCQNGSKQIASCSSSYETTTGTDFIRNQTGQQTSANFNIQAASGTVAATIQGASGQDIVDFVGSGGATLASIDASGTVHLIGATIINSSSTNGYNQVNSTLTNSNTSASSVATSAYGIQLTGTSNTSGGTPNALNGVSFANVTPVTGNSFTGLNFGTGYNSLLTYNGSSLINGNGLLQNAGFDSTLNYSNLQKVTNLTATGNLTVQGTTTVALAAAANDTAVCSNAGVLSSCTDTFEATTGNDFIKNNPGSRQTSSSFNIAAGAGKVAATIQGASSQDVADFLLSGGGNAFKIDSAGTITAAGDVIANGALQSGTASVAGLLELQDGSGHKLTLTSGVLSAASTITLPAPASGTTATVCYQNDPSCGFALTAGSGSYVQLDPASAQTDITNNNSIFINRTAGSGNILDLQYNTSDALIVNSTGDTSIAGTHTLTVGSGATTLGGTLGVTGLTTLSGGVTVANINTTAGTNTALGNSTGTFSLASSALNISTAGALTGVTGITTSGGYTQSGSTSNTFSGIVNLGVTGSLTGTLQFKGSTAASGTLVLIAPNNPSNNTLTLPNETGTLCSTGSICAGYQATPTSGSFVRTNPAATSDNTVVAPATAAVVALTLKGNATANAHVLDIYNSAATPALQDYFDANGSLNVSQLIQPTANNTIDLGTSSARFRTGYFGTSVDVAGTTLTANQLQFVKGATSTINPAQEAATTDGDILALQGGAAGTGGNNNGGNVTIDGGALTGTGTKGKVVLQGGGGNVQIGSVTNQNANEVLSVAKATNSFAAVSIHNSNTGTAADAVFAAYNDNNGTTTNGALFGVGGANFNTVPLFGNRAFTYAGSGLSGAVIDTAAATPIVFGINNTEVARFSGSGNLLVGNTSGTALLSVGSSAQFTVDSSGNVATSGTYNTNTFTSSALTFGASSTATIQSAASQALNITGHAASTISTDSGDLTIQGGSNNVVVGGTNPTVKSSGTNTLTIDTGGAAQLNLGTGNANAISISKTGVTTTINGALTVTQAATFNGGITIGNNSSFDQSSSTGTFKTGSGAVSLNGDTTVASGKHLIVTTLGAASNDTALCYNASSQVASCTDTFAVTPASGSYIKQVPATTADNTIAPTANSVVGLTVKGTTGTAAHVLDIYNSNVTPSLQDYFDANGLLNVGQIIQPTSNNAIDIGTSSARFRTGYFGTSLDVAGTTLTSSQLQFTNGGTRTINVAQEAATTNGDVLALVGGAAGTGGNNNGGNVTIDGGALTGTGTKGNVILQGAGGNVGIGTSGTPSKLLSVGGTTGSFTVDTTGKVSVGTIGTASTLFLVDAGANANSTEAIGIHNNSNGTNAASVFSAYNDNAGASTHYGLFGVGGTGYTGVSMLQNYAFADAGAGTSGLALNTQAAIPIVFGINSSEVARFSGSGNFLLGNTSGTSLLSVGSSAQFTVDSSGNVATSGTYNTNTFTSSALTFGAASGATIQAANNQNLTVQSQGTGQLILNSAGAALSFATGGTSRLQLGASGDLTFQQGGSTIGTATTNGGLNVQANGTGTLNLNTSGAGEVDLGAANSTTVKIGNASSTNTVLGATNIDTTGTATTTIGNATGNTTVKLQNNSASSLTVNTGGTSIVGTLTVGTFGAAANNSVVCQNAGVLTSCNNSFATTPASGNYIEQVPGTTAENTILPTAASVVALTVKGTSSATTAHILDIYNSGASQSLQAYFDAAGSLNVSQLIQPTANNTIDLGTGSARFRTGYFGTSVDIAGTTLSSTALTFTGAGSITSTGATTLGIDTGGAAALSLGTGSANAVSISKSGVTTTVNGALTVTQLGTFNGGATIATGQHFIVNGDDFTDLTGSGLVDTSNALTVDATSSTGFFRNGGNNFGGNATLGTTGASQTLSVITANTSRLIVDTAASTNFTFQQATNLNVLANGTANAAGLGLTLQAGAANGSTTGNTGGVLALVGGSAAGSGNNNGGNVTIDGGAKVNSGSKGNVVLQGAGGNVGIGIAPVKTLDVFNATTDVARFGNNTGSAAALVLDANEAASTNAVRIQANYNSGTTNNYLAILTGGSERLRVTDTGNLLVGNTSGTSLLSVGSSAQLTVDSSGNIATSGNATVTGTYNTNTFTSSALTFGAASTATIQAAASQALNITGHAASTFSTDSGDLTLQSGSTNILIGGTNPTIKSTSTNTLTVDTGGSAQLNLGTGNANAISIGKAGVLTTIGGSLKVTTLAATGGDSVICQSSGTLGTCADTFAVTPASGSYIKQVPAATSDNTISPTAASVVGLTVKGTTNASSANVLEIYNSAVSPTRQDYFDANGSLNVGQKIQATTSGVDLGVSGSNAFNNVYGTTLNAGSTTLTNTGLTFGVAGTATIQSAASQTLNITGHAASTFSTDSGDLTIQGGSNNVVIGGTNPTVKSSGTNDLNVTAGGALNLTGAANSAFTVGNTHTLAITSQNFAVTAPGAVTALSYNALTLTAQATGFTIAGGTTSKTLTLAGNLTYSSGNVLSPSDTNASLTVNPNGSGSLTLDTAGANSVSLGNANATSVQIGNTANASAVSIDTKASGNINIGTGGQDRTISIGTGNATNTETVIIGSTFGGTTTLQSAGGISVSGHSNVFTNTPNASVTASLLRLGPNAIASGSGQGTYLGINQSTGATADFLNFQVNGVYMLKVTSTGLVDSTQGFAVGGAAGVGANCSGGQVLTGATYAGGIATAGTCSSPSGFVTLQDAYNNSAGIDPQIQINSSYGGVKIYDSATPSGGNLFTVANHVSPGQVQFFNVTAAGISTSGTLTVSGAGLSTVAGELDANNTTNAFKAIGPTKVTGANGTLAVGTSGQFTVDANGNIVTTGSATIGNTGGASPQYWQMSASGQATFTFNSSNNADVSTWTVNNKNGGTGTTTLNAQTISLTNVTNGAGGTNVLNGVNFSSVTGANANNIYNGLNFGTGFSSVLKVSGTSIINGSGVVQNAGINGSYTNLTGTGALAAGSITSGFGSIQLTGGQTISTTGGALQGDTLGIGTSSFNQFTVTNAGVVTAQNDITGKGALNIGTTGQLAVSNAGNITDSGTLTLTGSGTAQLKTSGTPTAATNAALVQFSSAALTGASASGTYLGINQGSGTADFLAFQQGASPVTVFNVASSGNVTSAGTITANAGFLISGAPTAGHFLRSNGTSFVDGTLQGSDGAGVFVRVNPSSTADNTITAPATATVVTLTLKGNSTANAHVLDIYNSAASPTLQSYFDNNGALTTSQLLTGNLGATIKGAIISLNDTSNFATSINGGTSTGNINIGNSVAGTFNADAGGAITLFNTNVAHTISIATGGTSTNQAVTIGSTNSGSTLTLQSAANISANSTGLSFSAANSAGTRTINILQSTTGAGGTLNLVAGQGTAATNSVGGNLLLQAGAGGGTGTSGNVIVKAQDTANTAAFQIQNSGGAALLTADTSTSSLRRILIGGGTPTLATTNSGDLFVSGSIEGISSIRIGTASNGINFTPGTAPTASAGLYSGASRPTKTIALAPEFAGLTLSGSGVGTLTSGFDATNFHNYYDWTTAQSTTQSYTMDVRVPVPRDFAAWTSSSQICYYIRSDDVTSAALTNTLYDSTNASISAVTYNNAGTNVPTTWTQRCAAISSSTNVTPGGYMTLTIAMTIGQNKNLYVGEISMDYLSSF